MNKYEKAICFNLIVIRALGILIIILNWILPLSSTYKWEFSIFRLLVTLIYAYGILTSTGVLCINTRVKQGDMILFEQNVASVVLVLGLIRIAQAIYYFVLKRDIINWIVIAFLVVLDIVYLIITMVDKSNYGYALQEEEKVYKI